MMYVKNHLNNINLMCQILHFVQCTQFADDFRLLIFILKRRKAEQQWRSDQPHPRPASASVRVSNFCPPMRQVLWSGLWWC